MSEPRESPLFDEVGAVCVVPTIAGIPVRKMLTAAGDGSGTFNLNDNYAATPLEAYYEATARLDIYTILINISDDQKFYQTGYGAIVAPGVQNGVKFFITPVGGPDIQLLASFGIAANYQWLAVTQDAVLTSFDGTPQTLAVQLNVAKDYGKPLRLEVGERIKVVLNDDFTGLVNHSFTIRGIQYPA